jgi:ABC-2 type transport system ATP-binding protein
MIGAESVMVYNTQYMKAPTLQLQNVSKQFGASRVIDGISFRVNKGEIVGFVGANGAGKTTTIGLLLGFISASQGTVAVMDKPVSAWTAHVQHGKIGYAAGDMELPRRLTGEQYLKFVAAQFASDKAWLDTLCRKFSPQLHKKIGTLSRGNKQKLALIAAFLPRPELVVLDEPTSGLDPIMQEAFLQLIREERERGTTIFMSSHYLNEVADVCTRIILMREGKIIEDIDAAKMLAQSGKQVRIVTGYAATLPPKGAVEISQEETDTADTVLSFTWKLPPRELQHWLAGVKQLKDIEVTEYDLEGAFRELYAPDEGAK